MITSDEPKLIISKLQEEIDLIKLRNQRVEAHKAWESSWTRIFSIALLTYLVMNLLLWTIGGPNPPVHALVPTAGFVLSTASLPKIKQWWINRNILK